MRSLFHDLDELLNSRVLQGSYSLNFVDSYCATKFITDESGATWTLSIPGVKPEEVDLSVDGEIASLKLPGCAVKRYKLDGKVYDLDALTAKLEYGILSVRLPRLSQQKNSARKIKVT